MKPVLDSYLERVLAFDGGFGHFLVARKEHQDFNRDTGHINRVDAGPKDLVGET